MPMNKLEIPISGQNFRPPARQVLSILPLGFPLELRPEPNNEFDEWAVRVIADMAELPAEKFPLLQKALENTSFDAHDIMTTMLMVGYLAATGKPTAHGGPGNQEAIKLCNGDFTTVRAHLSAMANGYASVVIEHD